MKTVFNPMIIRAALHARVVIWINQRGEPIGFCHG